MENSAIQWTHHTFNPWIGCTKVSPECKNCYAETLMDTRYGRVKWGKGNPRVRTSPANWKLPRRWNKDVNGTRARVFCASLSDWLDDDHVPIEWLADLLETVRATPNLDWLLLSKRPQNWKARIEEVESRGLAGVEVTTRWLNGNPPANVWIGVSAGADAAAALDIPAAVHFLSCEPMLRPMDETHAAGFDWIIFGGESGAGARACSVPWIRDGIAFCRKHGIAPFVKQLGAFVEPPMTLRDHKGGDMSEWPEDLRVREFPNPRPLSSKMTTGRL